MRWAHRVLFFRHQAQFFCPSQTFFLSLSFLYFFLSFSNPLNPSLREKHAMSCIIGMMGSTTGMDACAGSNQERGLTSSAILSLSSNRIFLSLSSNRIFILSPLSLSPNQKTTEGSWINFSMKILLNVSRESFWSKKMKKKKFGENWDEERRGKKLVDRTGLTLKERPSLSLSSLTLSSLPHSLFTFNSFDLHHFEEKVREERKSSGGGEKEGPV